MAAGADAEKPSTPETAAPFPFLPGNACPKERWDAALEALRGQEFALYCGLLDAGSLLADRKSADEKDENGNPNAGSALILDITDRYSYEVLRLDRNRMLLKNVLEPLSDGVEIVLRHGDLWISCRDAARPAEGSDKSAKKISGRRPASKRERETPPGAFIPAGGSEIPEEAEAPRGARTGEVPFEGLVEEASRWLRGDVLLVRRGGEEDDMEAGVDEHLEDA
jgi:hypothetical protein